MKHESAYAVFLPNGRVAFPSIRPTKQEAIKAWVNPIHWPYHQKQGYTVRPVAVTEVKR